MQFSGKNAFLLLRREPAPGNEAIRIVADFPLAIPLWNNSSRVSPVFGVTNREYSSPVDFEFPGKWSLIFLGPVHPENVFPLASIQCHVWLSVGLFNVVLAVDDAPKATSIVDWAKEEQLPYERWEVEDGSIRDMSTWQPPDVQGDWRDVVARICKSAFRDELKEAIQEYCPLMASAISRSGGLPFDFATELVSFNQTVARLLEVYYRNVKDDRSYWALGQFLVINAGLSRFSSQTFAGATPIEHTECHFWLHSLLGIGLATAALRNVRTFIQSTLGEARLHDRFSALAQKTNTLDLTKRFPPDADYLGEVELGSPDPIIPLLTYFSARDGYRSTELTVSAPLAAVAACNSQRWSLLTLTHEFSHVIIRAIQARLYPDNNNPADLLNCLALIEANAPAENLFEEIRRIVLFSIVKMDDAAQNRKAGDSIDLNLASLQALLQRWRQDVDEILVHAFDFMYFYGQDVDKYVRGIWASWGTIPNIGTRVLDYVVRSICAVLTKHLRRGSKGEAFARDEVRAVLGALPAHGTGRRYIDQAIQYIDQYWDDVVLPRVRARRQLVKIVNVFLFSEGIATQVRGETQVSGGAGKKEGYEIVRGDLEVRRITNPLHFIEVFTDTLTPNATDSAWILYMLAFGCEPNG
jgi:hypothetical protein